MQPCYRPDLPHRPHSQNCACCGCSLGDSGDRHFHHKRPEKLDKQVRKMMKRNAHNGLCTVGPDDLFDMEHSLKESGLLEESRKEFMSRLQVGDMVKLDFLVTDHTAPWLPEE